MTNKLLTSEQVDDITYICVAASKLELLLNKSTNEYAKQAKKTLKNFTTQAICAVS